MQLPYGPEVASSRQIGSRSSMLRPTIYDRLAVLLNPPPGGGGEGVTGGVHSDNRRDQPTQHTPWLFGHVDEPGRVLPPFRWDDDRLLRAKLDAFYIHLYRVTDRDDMSYIYSTLPFVESEEAAAYGTYRSRDLDLAWASALVTGNPDAALEP